MLIQLMQVQKVLEVYEQVKQRMGVVIVGPPQTGKSTVCRILKMVRLNYFPYLPYSPHCIYRGLQSVIEIIIVFIYFLSTALVMVETTGSAKASETESRHVFIKPKSNKSKSAFGSD